MRIVITHQLDRYGLPSNEQHGPSHSTSTGADSQQPDMPTTTATVAAGPANSSVSAHGGFHATSVHQRDAHQQEQHHQQPDEEPQLDDALREQQHNQQPQHQREFGTSVHGQDSAPPHYHNHNHYDHEGAQPPEQPVATQPSYSVQQPYYPYQPSSQGGHQLYDQQEGGLTVPLDYTITSLSQFSNPHASRGSASAGVGHSSSYSTGDPSVTVAYPVAPNQVTVQQLHHHPLQDPAAATTMMNFFQHQQQQQQQENSDFRLVGNVPGFPPLEGGGASYPMPQQHFDPQRPLPATPFHHGTTTPTTLNANEALAGSLGETVPFVGSMEAPTGPTLVLGATLSAQRVNPQSFLNHGVPLREHHPDSSYYSHGLETERRLASMVSTLEPVGEAPPYTRDKKEPLFSQWFHNALRECVVDILSLRIPVPTNAALDTTLSTRPTNPHGYETTFPLGSSLPTSVVRAHFMTKFFADAANLNETSEVLFKLFNNHLHPWKGGGAGDGARSSHSSTEFGQEYHCWLTEEYHKEQYRSHDTRLVADLFIPGEVRISLLPQDASFDVDLSALPVHHLLEAIVKSHVLAEFKVQEGKKLEEIRQAKKKRRSSRGGDRPPTLPATLTLVGSPAPLEEQNVNASSQPTTPPKSQEKEIPVKGQGKSESKKVKKSRKHYEKKLATAAATPDLPQESALAKNPPQEGKVEARGNGPAVTSKRFMNLNINLSDLFALVWRRLGPLSCLHRRVSLRRIVMVLKNLVLAEIREAAEQRRLEVEEEGEEEALLQTHLTAVYGATLEKGSKKKAKKHVTVKIRYARDELKDLKASTWKAQLESVQDEERVDHPPFRHVPKSYAKFFECHAHMDWINWESPLMHAPLTCQGRSEIPPRLAEKESKSRLATGKRGAVATANTSQQQAKSTNPGHLKGTQEERRQQQKLIPKKSSLDSLSSATTNTPSSPPATKKEWCPPPHHVHSSGESRFGSDDVTQWFHDNGSNFQPLAVTKQPARSVAVTTMTPRRHQQKEKQQHKEQHTDEANSGLPSPVLFGVEG